MPWFGVSSIHGAEACASQWTCEAPAITTSIVCGGGLPSVVFITKLRPWGTTTNPGCDVTTSRTSTTCGLPIASAVNVTCPTCVPTGSCSAGAVTDAVTDAGVVPPWAERASQGTCSVAAGGVVPTDFLKSVGVRIETKYGTA